MSHYPVMLPDVIEYLSPAKREVYVDGTFGAGGYTRAFLDSADCKVIAIDRDKDAVTRARAFEDEYGERFVFLPGCFGDAEDLLAEAGFEQVDGFVLDLGVSSMQIDRAARGFSFREDGPLDMRMDQRGGKTAADIVNTWPEQDLADVIYRYGEERHSRRIARRIAERRQIRKFETTGDLASLVRSCVKRSKKDDIDPATRTFQALRIAVNDELGELERALSAAEKILKPGGRMIVVSFHSLEDGIVKKYFRDKSATAPKASRHAPEVKSQSAALFKLLTRKAVAPSAKEVAENPRSRSAKLRAAVRTEGPS